MAKVYVYGNNQKATPNQWKTLRKVEDDLQKEMYKQLNMISGSVGIALYEYWGWRHERLHKLYKTIDKLWEEIADDPNVSAFKLCEDETGMVISIPDFDGTWSDLLYYKDKAYKKDLPIQQLIYTRIRQKKWIGAEVVASVMVALHRMYGFGYERLSRLYEQMDESRNRYDWDAKKIRQECFRITGESLSAEDYE